MVNNYDLFKDISFIHFLRDVGKFITVNYMMAKDSVKKRIEGDNGISYTEFAYQLMQGYDFYWLYQNMNCKMQMGGSDQWGNIVTGTELIRKKAGGDAFAFTCPLLTKSDGGKFGKTEKGNIWLDAARTSAYKFYQFWLNSADDDAKKWIKIFTFLTAAEIEALVAEHDINPGLRTLQRKLAEEITLFVHGAEGYEKAIATTAKLNDKNLPASALSEEDLKDIDGIELISYDAQKLRDGIDVVTFLAETGIFTSKGEARKSVQGRGVSINRAKVEGTDVKITEDFLLHRQYLLVQKGQKNFWLVKAE
jgi:tyrosyl-tRNA synthetase